MAELEAQNSQETDKMLGEYQGDDDDMKPPKLVSRFNYLY
jgi:hypothetical protein